MATFVPVAAALTLVLALGGGADAQLLDCLGGQRPTQVAELMFGRNIGGRLGVNEADWSRFVDREITSRFPNGLTVLNAAGQWRDEATNKIVREPGPMKHGGSEIAFVEDPDGYKIELIQLRGRSD